MSDELIRLLPRGILVVDAVLASSLIRGRNLKFLAKGFNSTSAKAVFTAANGVGPKVAAVAAGNKYLENPPNRIFFTIKSMLLYRINISNYCYRHCHELP